MVRVQIPFPRWSLLRLQSVEFSGYAVRFHGSTNLLPTPGTVEGCAVARTLAELDGEPDVLLLGEALVDAEGEGVGDMLELKLAVHAIAAPLQLPESTSHVRETAVPAKPGRHVQLYVLTPC